MTEFKAMVYGTLFLLGSCAPAYKRHIPAYHFAEASMVPDYSKWQYWAANPKKWSPSDSCPMELKASFKKDTTVDVFFLHPTTFGRKQDTAWNADINDAAINAKTDYTTILYQASAFNEFRIFAPRYRQANIKAYYTADTASATRAFDLAYLDLKAAFQYYLDHYNMGRPIIIAAHSQGTTHAKRLLKEFFDNKPLKSKLIAAYIIGMDIPKNYYGDLRACEDSLETGCFIGWRTYLRGYEPPFIKRENGNSYVVNPLTWTTDSRYAPDSLNKGGVLKRFDRVFPRVADAQIQDDILWIRKPHFRGSFFFRSKNFHIGDINFYYMNIRQNAHARANAFRH